ncbi:hypothetical protein ET532_013355 [Verminephrobacter sp. Larva24]|nr:hypothetical protein ET532_013355 [Verminephrobacter sp. Larva24]
MSLNPRHARTFRCKGQVIDRAACARSMTDRLHRHQQWLRFLQLIDRQTPKIGSIMGPKLTHGRATKWQQSAPSWC